MTATQTPDVEPSRVRLSLIRDFSVAIDGMPVEVPPMTQRVICYVALQAMPVRRSRVIGALWADSEESRACASLRSALWRLPCEAPVLGVSNSHLWLLDGVQVDLRDAFTCGATALSGATADEYVVTLAAELLSYGQELLPGWYDDWVAVERERFRQLRLHALDKVGDTLLDSGRLWEAIEVAMAAVESEPLRESAHRQLLRAHLLEGNVSEALREYSSYARLLRRELNAIPSQALRSLVTPFVLDRHPKRPEGRPAA